MSNSVRVVATVILMTASSPVLAKWNNVETGIGDYQHMVGDKVRSLGSFVTFWSKAVYTENTSQYMTMEMAADCDTFEYHVRQRFTYDRDESPSLLRKESPFINHFAGIGTVNEALINKACSIAFDFDLSEAGEMLVVNAAPQILEKPITRALGVCFPDEKQEIY